MGAIDVDLAVDVPEGLCVVAGKVEVYGVGPRCRIVQVFALEDDLKHCGQHKYMEATTGRS